MSSTLKITLFAHDEKNWTEEFIKYIENFEIVEIEKKEKISDEDQFVFIHENEKDLRKIIHTFSGGDIVFFLVTEKGDFVSPLLKNGQIEDALVYPFRVVELLGKLKLCQHLLLWKEMNSLNSRLEKVTEGFKGDIELASRLQKLCAPRRFKPLKIMTPFYRYFAGTKPGGNYFDLMTSINESSYSILLSDSSSYGLSSLVLSMVLKIAVKVNAGELSAPDKTAEMILHEALSTLREKDKLSLFFGSLSRFSSELSYVHFGENLFLYAQDGKKFEIIPTTGDALSQRSALPLPPSHVIKLNPKDRLVLISKGLSEECGGEKEVMNIINQRKDKRLEDILNDLSVELRVKMKNSNKEFPDKDCTMSFFELSDKVTQLRKIESVG